MAASSESDEEASESCLWPSSTTGRLIRVLIVLAVIGGAVAAAVVLTRPDSTAAVEEHKTLSEVKDRGFVRCGITDSSLGRSSIDPTTRERVGFNVELVRRRLS